MITTDELRAKLATTNRTPEEIDKIITKFEKSIAMRDVVRIERKSFRVKIQELLEGMNTVDCRFFQWFPGLGIFVHREGDKAKVSFSFLNSKDIVPGFKYDIRSTNFYALANFKSGRYTYEVDWRGRSEFAAYDAFIKYHKEFPLNYRDLMMDICVYRPKYEK